MKAKFFIPVILLAVGFVLVSFDNGQGDPWPVPEKYEKMKNPEEANSSSLKAGAMLWKRHCQSCHGKEGLGDGPKAATLDTPSGDFSSDEFQAQSDGAIFYKTVEGRGDMPSYKKRIPDEEDIWHLVNFMRDM